MSKKEIIEWNVHTSLSRYAGPSSVNLKRIIIKTKLFFLKIQISDSKSKTITYF